MGTNLRWLTLALLTSAACATSEGPPLPGNPPNTPDASADASDASADVADSARDTSVDTSSTMDAPPAVNCGAVTQCGTCASLGPCGWCGATGTCMNGTAAGPSVGACASNWTLNPATCPAPDASADVSADASSDGRVDVSADGAADVTDASVDARADASDAGDPCAAAATCGGCTAMASCGFCQATGRCQTGNRDAPTVGPACPMGWAWVSSSCMSAAGDAGADVTMADPCVSATSCATCTQRSQCGWCPGLNRCLLGTGTGPNTMAATCGTWAWYSGQCSAGDASTDASTDASADAGDAGDPCVSATTCSSCTARSQCGWCPGANRCAVGTSSGPSGTVAACGAWAWVSSACMADGGTDAGTDAGADAGTTGGIGGFGPSGSFPAADVARACPPGATMRIAVSHAYATPRAPSGAPWDGIPGVSDFVCSATSDRVAAALRDQINMASMGTGDTVDRLVGDRFRMVVSTQCGTAADWFLSRWEGPDMFAQLFAPSTTSSARWRTSTESDSWEAPRTGATWPDAYVDVPCAALSTGDFRLEVRDEDLIGSERVGGFSFRGDQVSPRAMCTGYAFREGVEGLAGVLFTVSVTGGTQNCTGLR